jgi:putative ABC transport system ATP-binding protein
LFKRTPWIQSLVEINMEYIINAKGIKKSFKNGEIVTHVLKGVDFQVKKGEFVSIMGRSGAGKSTLMYQLSLLDEPTEGEILVDGVDVLKLTNKEKTSFRLQELGYVFQDYALVPELTAKENVSLPLLLRGIPPVEAYKKAEEVLNKLGFDVQINNLPSQLSGGEQQRVSIARSIIDEPKILFTDEPTANLDGESARMVIDILKDLNKKGQTIVMVTHEEEYGLETDRIVRLKDGLICN